METFIAGLVVGIIVGGVVVYCLIHNVDISIRAEKQESKTLIIRIPNIMYDNVEVLGNMLELSPTEALDWAVKAGVAALTLYADKEGGFFVYSDAGNALQVPWNPLENSNDARLRPFQKFLDNIDQDSL